MSQNADLLTLPQQDHRIRSTGLVSVIMIFLDEERFIEEAIQSVLAQSYQSWELLLVDDGSSDGSTEIAGRYAAEHPDRVRYLEHPGHENRGMSAARNLGLRHARGEYVAFLDADDVYLPPKLEKNVEALRNHPYAGMVYGATEYWHSWNGAGGKGDWTWNQFGVSPDSVVQPPVLLGEYLRDGGTVPCACGLLVRRSVAEAIGGFEDQFRGLYEDQAFLAKVCLASPVVVVSDCLDRYRQHSDSICHRSSIAQVEQARQQYLAWLRDHLVTSGVAEPSVLAALDAAEQADRTAQHRKRKRPLLKRVKATVARLVPAPIRRRIERRRREPRPRVGQVRFGDLRRVEPISRVWGRERGRSLDRYYIESFLALHRGDIRGRVLEIGDATYTTKYGGNRVLQSDVLNVNAGDPATTIVADLASADHIPSDTFDCIILTQTLQLIYDVPAALRTLRHILKPGGVLLTTFPGITHTGDADWHATWYWSFTTNSARRLFSTCFGAENLEISSFGNVLAATAFLYGLADRELRREELDHHDPAYDMIIAVRAIKPAAG